tara:strand:+ start:1031 stop:1174 length:144 start_codon:yes stop_codon:yes gene_type:complete
MIKKIFLLTLFCCLIISCGKKGDPIYKEPKKETRIQKISFIKLNEIS